MTARGVLLSTLPVNWGGGGGEGEGGKEWRGTLCPVHSVAIALSLCVRRGGVGPS